MSAEIRTGVVSTHIAISQETMQAIADLLLVQSFDQWKDLVILGRDINTYLRLGDRIVLEVLPPQPE